MSLLVRLRRISEDAYQASDGRVLQREYGLTPNGNPLNGRWVLRAADGTFLDFDSSRNDIAEHNDLRFDS